MAKSKTSIEDAANSTTGFTSAQIADFREGTLQLKGLDLIKMRKQEKAEAELEALRLIEGLKADPTLRSEITQSWAKDYEDENGDIVSPFDTVDFNDLLKIEGFFEGAMKFCANARSGKLDVRQMGTVVSFSEPMTVGNGGTLKNITVTGTLDDGTPFSARLNDARTKTMGSLLHIGSKVELSTDRNGGLWVDSVITESAEVVKQREEMAVKARKEKEADIELSNKGSKGAAILGLANSGNLQDAASIQAVLDAISKL